MLANWITLARLPLLLINVLILYLGSPSLRLIGVAVLFLGLMLDTVDGVVARRTGQTSLFGSVLDIAADRTFELVLWVCFASLGMIPVTIPLIVIARTTLTDAFRSIGVAHGAAPFAQHRSTIGRFVVSSPIMKIGYSASKTITFCGLALVSAFRGYPPDSAVARAAAPMIDAFRVTAWVAVGFCLFRGLPVIIGTLKRYWRTPIGGGGLTPGDAEELPGQILTGGASGPYVTDSCRRDSAPKEFLNWRFACDALSLSWPPRSWLPARRRNHPRLPRRRWRRQRPPRSISRRSPGCGPSRSWEPLGIAS